MPYRSIEQKREYQRLWVARNRQEYLQDKSCVVCGATNDLEVDHIDPRLKIGHSIWSWKKERRLAELAKCQVLCVTHHLDKTLGQRHKTTHGTARMYGAHGCRCLPCRQAKSIENSKRKR